MTTAQKTIVHNSTQTTYIFIGKNKDGIYVKNTSGKKEFIENSQIKFYDLSIQLIQSLI